MIIALLKLVIAVMELLLQWLGWEYCYSCEHYHPNYMHKKGFAHEDTDCN